MRLCSINTPILQLEKLGPLAQSFTVERSRAAIGLQADWIVACTLSHGAISIHSHPPPQPALTLDDGQQDDDDKEEEGNVEDHPIELIFITCRVLNLVPNATTGPDTHIHVKQVTLGMRGIWSLTPVQWSCTEYQPRPWARQGWRHSSDSDSPEPSPLRAHRYCISDSPEMVRAVTDRSRQRGQAW